MSAYNGLRDALEAVREQLASVQLQVEKLTAEREILSSQLWEQREGWKRRALRAERAERILAALREPGETVVEKACLALFGAYWSRDDLGDVVWRADARQRFITQLRAAVAAAEQEVGG